MKVAVSIFCTVLWSAFLFNTPYCIGQHKLEQQSSLIIFQQIFISEAHDAVQNFHWCLKIRSLEKLLKRRKRNTAGNVTYYDTRNVKYRGSSFVNGNIFGDDSKGSACIRETGNSNEIKTSKKCQCHSRAFNCLVSNHNFHLNTLSTEPTKETS